MAVTWTASGPGASLVPIDPCGAICDWSRCPAWTRPCQWFADRPDLIGEIKWRPALPDADVLPYASAFLAKEWDRWGYQAPPLGEVYGTPMLYYPGVAIPGSLGTHVCGTAEQFAGGVMYDPTINVRRVSSGLPVCCAPAILGQISVAASPAGQVGAVPGYDRPTGGLGIGGAVNQRWTQTDRPTGGLGIGGLCLEYGPGGDRPRGGLGIGGTLTERWAAADRPVGGIGLGGPVTEGPTTHDTPSGGLGIGGPATETWAALDAPTGGIGLGGTAGEVYLSADSPAGGLGIGGPVTQTVAAADVPAGGLGIGGPVTQTVAAADVPAGGLGIGGPVTQTVAAVDVPAGGLGIGGPVSEVYIPPSGSGYTNGVLVGQTSAGVIGTYTGSPSGGSISNSFILGGALITSQGQMGIWCEPGDIPQSVTWAIGTTFFDGSLGGGTVTPVSVFQFTNVGGFDVYLMTIPMIVSLAAGTYYLTLSHGRGITYPMIFWDINNGPSVAEADFLSVINPAQSNYFKVE